MNHDRTAAAAAADDDEEASPGPQVDRDSALSSMRARLSEVAREVGFVSNNGRARPLATGL
jgi:hypothetical protein